MLRSPRGPRPRLATLSFMTLLCAAAIAPSNAPASPETGPGGSPGRTLDVTPNDGDNLPSPASINVIGAGWGANQAVRLFQCTADLTICSPQLGNATSNAGGTFSTTINVTRVFNPDPAGAAVDCGVTSCRVFADLTNNNTAFASHHLTFAVAGGGPPAAPTVSATSPASPANNNSPAIIGSAAAGTTVNLFTNSACTGTPVATGSAATLASPGIPVPVADNSTTTFFATATNGANQTSACSTSSVTYVEDSSLAPDPNDPGTPGGDTDPPETTITKDPPKRTDAERVKFKFISDEEGSSFQCKFDKKPFKPCRSPRKIKVDEGKHKFQVRAVDASGNVDTSADKDKFKVVN